MRLTHQQLLLATPSRWHPAAVLTRAPSGDWRGWLQERGSLTRRLQACARQDFQVRVLQEGVAPAHPSETALLGGVHRRLWVRQVLLEVDGQPWVFARSLLPLDDRSGLLRQVLQVGNQALGHLLFSNPQVRRGPLVFCAPDQLPFPSLWGRASCFHGQQLQLLVAEHFLPAMAENLNLPWSR